MLGDYSSDIEDRTAAAVRELRETARELEVSRSDYAEMQRAVQLLQVIHNVPARIFHGNILSVAYLSPRGPGLPLAAGVSFTQPLRDEMNEHFSV